MNLMNKFTARMERVVAKHDIIRRVLSKFLSRQVLVGLKVGGLVIKY